MPNEVFTVLIVYLAVLAIIFILALFWRNFYHCNTCGHENRKITGAKYCAQCRSKLGTRSGYVHNPKLFDVPSEYE